MIHYVGFGNRESYLQEGSYPRILHVTRSDSAKELVPRAMHAHSSRLEIVYLFHGSGQHMIGDNRYETRAGDLLIYNQNVPHDERACAKDLKYYCCGITGLHYRDLPENCLIRPERKPVLTAGSDGPAIEALYQLLYREVTEEQLGSEETGQYLMLALLSKVIGILERTEEGVQEADQDELGQRIKRYIDENYLMVSTLGELSANLGISQFHLDRIFKAQTGYSPIQYLINRRMGEAQTLLEHTNYPIIQIARMVGYENTNYFHLLFKKKIGMSPGKYRKWMWEEHF